MLASMRAGMVSRAQGGVYRIGALRVV